VPKQHVESGFDLGLLDYCHVHGEPARSAKCACDELRADLWIGAYAPREVDIEDRESAWFQYLPAVVAGYRCDRVFALPRPQEIADCEELDSEALGEIHAPQEYPVKHEQPKAHSRRGWPAAWVPPAAWNLEHRGASSVGRGSELCGVESLAEFGVVLQNSGDSNATRSCARNPGLQCVARIPLH
jgi:hypothetical protein